MAILLFTRRGCHLCEVAEDLVGLHRSDAQIVDVDADQADAARYGLRVPVLEIDGVVAVEGPFDEPRLLAALAAIRPLTDPG